MPTKLPIVQSEFEQEQAFRNRYDRHINLPQVGLAGQRKIAQSRILIVGCGGLGAPAMLYLAAAGVGHLGLCDSDTVDISNLQRQIIYSTQDCGHRKTEVSAKKIKQLNPNISVKIFEALADHNAMEICSNYDIVVDCTDSLSARYILSDVCRVLDKPHVYGSIYQFEGQVSVFHASHGPCYRCIFPKKPTKALAPNCAEAGVLGVLPGIIGTMQATEALKLILNLNETLIGKLLCYNALSALISKITLPHKCMHLK